MAVFVRILPAVALLAATATSLRAQGTPAPAAQPAPPVCEASSPGGSVGAARRLRTAVISVLVAGLASSTRLASMTPSW